MDQMWSLSLASHQKSLEIETWTHDYIRAVDRVRQVWLAFGSAVLFAGLLLLAVYLWRISPRTSDKWPYFLTTIAVALFPLALAGYGGHLATLALKPGSKDKRRALVIVWGLAVAGIFFFAITQIIQYRADKRRESADNRRESADGAFRARVLQQLQEIADEPDTNKKKEAAKVLQKRVELSPARSQTFGNLRPRCDGLTMQITQSLAQRQEKALDMDTSHRSVSRNELDTWSAGTDMIFRNRHLASLLSLHDELKSLHISDPKLDEILERIAEDDRDPRLLESQKWINFGDIETMATRLGFLCKEIPDR